MRHAVGGRGVLPSALMALSLAASPALATCWTVEIGGGGDFTTIQAAIDQQAIEFRDTILVMPGDYAETLTPPVLGDYNLKTVLVSSDGAAVTSMHSIEATAHIEARGYAKIDGFTFTHAVSLIGHHPDHYRFVHCVFLDEVNWYSLEESFASIDDCSFYARTRLSNFAGRATQLRFYSAPLVVSSVGGLSHFALEDCVFEGPTDTLVYVPPLSDEGDHFVRCTFTNARIGIVFQGRRGFMGVGVVSCLFSDLSKAGIWMDDSTNWDPSGGDELKGLFVGDSRFERCGTGIHWAYWKPRVGGAACLVRDTILASTRDGVILGPAMDPLYGGLFDCIVEGNGERGAAFLQNYDEEVGWLYSNYQVVRSRFANNGGDGLFVQDSLSRPVDPWGEPDRRWRTRVIGCTFANNGGAGLRIESSTWRVDSCVAVGNAEDGFSLRSTAPEYRNSATHNSSALNHGDGFRFTVRGTPSDSLLFIERNLAAMNVGAGIRVPFNGGLRRFAYNDAWNNYLAQYVAPGSPADSNLTVNPRFCDLGAGDLGLEQGSPCGPGGLYGLIGALPESCPNTLAVEPTAGVGVAFAVRPSVARGSVEFVPPTSGEEGEVELFDLAGRVVWHSPLGPATGAIRWRGQGDAGHVRAGLYWARFTRGEERATRRLVWLE